MPRSLTSLNTEESGNVNTVDYELYLEPLAI